MYVGVEKWIKMQYEKWMTVKISRQHTPKTNEKTAQSDRESSVTPAKMLPLEKSSVLELE